MNGMQYCHNNNLYYGDMKTANLLIFRDQRVKIGDLGISVRVDYSDREGKDKKYFLKGATQGFLPDLMMLSLQSEEPVSKKEMFSADEYSLQITFKSVIARLDSQIEFELQKYQFTKDTNNLDKDRAGDIYFLEMVEDLCSQGLKKTIRKWKEIFQNNIEFSIDLSNHLLYKEFKY